MKNIKKIKNGEKKHSKGIDNIGKQKMERLRVLKNGIEEKEI